MQSSFLLLTHNLLGKLSSLVTLFGILALDVNFRDQITLGTIILGGIVVIIAGIFTIRSKIAASWHDAYLATLTKCDIKEKELASEKLDRAKFEKEQQELRHDLKNEIAARDLQLKSLEARTDLTTALTALRDLGLAQEQGNKDTHALLTEIRDRMPMGDTQ